MPLFDFHVHPAMKASFRLQPTAADVLQTVTRNDISPTIRCIVADGYKVFTSQVNYNFVRENANINQGGIVLGHALYAPEKAILEGLLQNLKVGKKRIPDPFGPSFAYAKIDKALQMQGGFTPFDWCLESYQLVQELRSRGWLHPLDHPDRLSQPSQGHVIEFFGVEGCHSLANHIDPFRINSAEIINNLEKLLDVHKVPIMHLMPVHMEQSPLANHAYGMQFITHAAFKPSGGTISQGLLDIVQYCQVRNICLDVKHLSYSARAFLYNMWPAMPQRRPIVCSHAGIAGMPKDDYRKYIYNVSPTRQGAIGVRLAKPWKYSRYASFNPSSINLFDEDIVQIIQSGGLIGISMDLRITGAHKWPGWIEANKHPFPHEVEYLAKNDIETQQVEGLFPDRKVTPATEAQLDRLRLLTWDRVSRLTEFYNLHYDYHLHCFVAQIIHVIQVAVKSCGLTQQQALNHICIGSDMDGLIAAIYPHENYNDFTPAFERDLWDAFAEVWHQGRLENDIGHPLYLSKEEFLVQLSWKSGFEFARRWLGGFN